MTVREYISSTLTGFDIPEASFTDLVVMGLNPDDEYTPEVAQAVGKGLVATVESIMFSPRRTNINENGFSESWNYADLGKYYLWLCRKYGVTPSQDMLALLGINSVIEITDIW